MRIARIPSLSKACSNIMENSFSGDQPKSVALISPKRFLFLFLVCLPIFLFGFHLRNNYSINSYDSLRFFESISRCCYTKNGSTIIFMQLGDDSEWLLLEACAIRATALINKETGVCVLTKVHMRSHPNLSSLPNLEIAHLNISSVFESTPLTGWYETYVSNVWELSDALRYAYVYKYGGRYLDTDILTLRSVSTLRNVTVSQGDGYLNGAVLFFEPDHPFLRAILNGFMKNFSPGFWGSVGPSLVTKIHSDGLVDNSTYAVLEPRSFYASPYMSFELPFKADKKKRVERMVNESYGLHLWRYMFHDHAYLRPWTNNFVPPNGSYIEEYISQYCA